jgi:hypothetical protein
MKGTEGFFSNNTKACQIFAKFSTETEKNHEGGQQL